MRENPPLRHSRRSLSLPLQPLAGKGIHLPSCIRSRPAQTQKTNSRLLQHETDQEKRGRGEEPSGFVGKAGRCAKSKQGPTIISQYSCLTLHTDPAYNRHDPIHSVRAPLSRSSSQSGSHLQPPLLIVILSSSEGSEPGPTHVRSTYPLPGVLPEPMLVTVPSSRGLVSQRGAIKSGR